LFKCAYKSYHQTEIDIWSLHMKPMNQLNRPLVVSYKSLNSETTTQPQAHKIMKWCRNCPTPILYIYTYESNISFKN